MTEPHKTFFEMVEDKEHWKNPIDAVIAVTDFQAVADAVEFYTATKLWIAEDLGNGTYRVVADGYQAGPAGDH